MLVNLASSIVLEARRNQRGLGVLEETRLLRGEYAFPELKDLSENEQKILLDAATVLFIEHNLCFRETFNEQTFLVFPSLINEKRPADEIIPTEEGASYRVKGAVENVYASLVVCSDTPILLSAPTNGRIRHSTKWAKVRYADFSRHIPMAASNSSCTTARDARICPHDVRRVIRTFPQPPPIGNQPLSIGQV